MEGRTHLLAAAAAAMLLSLALGLHGLEAGAALFASLAAARVPDADLRRSHRVLLHNLPAAAAVSAASLLLFLLAVYKVAMG